VLRALEELKKQERSMYELNNRKDQVMTVYKVALANLAMWVRDRYFPLSYAQVTWKRLLPFFSFPARSRRTPRWFRSNYARSMTGRSIVTWPCCVNGSTKPHRICLMDADSCSPSVQRVAFLLRRRRPKYRESLITWLFCSVSKFIVSALACF
jgi:hypothetical protein